MNNYMFAQPTQTPPDSMPDWQEADTSSNNSGAHNNHGMPAGGNGVGGAPGTHENHHSKVPMRDDVTTSGDDKAGYGAA